MKYENPNMEILELDKKDMIITSLGEGGSHGETSPGEDDDKPSVSW